MRTVAKMMRLDQDERYDIPTVGPDTLRHMAQAKLRSRAARRLDADLNRRSSAPSP
ncbi:MAG: UDP-2,3-diacylglucosamine diphosphatase LpxI domain-containing protein [Cloacibacillus evryensis]